MLVVKYSDRVQRAVIFMVALVDLSTLTHRPWKVKGKVDVLTK